MDQNGPAQEIDQSVSKQETATPTVDKPYIAEKLGVETNSLEQIDNDILLKIKIKVDEVESLKSHNVVLGLNLEQLNHTTNRKVETLKDKIVILTKEKSSLDESLKNSREAQVAYENEIANLKIEKNSTLKLLEEKEELIVTIEKEKIHSFEIIKRREDENKTLRDELAQLSKNNKELRSELINLETLTQKSSSELLKLKFDKNNLNQELEILKKNSSWYENELNKKMEELKTFKVDKYKEFSSLQLELESTKSQLHTLTAKYDSLKQNYDSSSKRLDDSLIKIKNLSDKIAYNQEDFLKEMSSKDKLIEILNKSNEERKQRVETLQATLDSLKTENVKGSSDLQIQLEKANNDLRTSSLKIQQLESTIDELLSTNGATIGANNHDASVISQVGSVPSTPRILKQYQQQELPLSPSAQQTLARIGGGISLTQLYSDFQLMKKQLIKERRLKENLERQVNQFVEELNKQVPAISATKERCSMLELELTDISIILEKTSKEKDTLLRENKNWSKKLNEYELELSTLNKSRIDLSRQIAHLMIQLSLKLEGDAPLTKQEKEYVDKLVGDYANGYNDESDTDKLITERLVKFKSVVELTNKNQELLKITRQLGNQLENQEKLNQEKINSLESVAIDEAREAIIVLQEQITTIEGKLSSVTRERDMFRSISAGHKQVNVFNSTPNSTTLEIKDTNKQASLESELNRIEEEFKAYKKETESTIKILNKQINELTNSKSGLAVQLAKATSSAQLFEERYKSVQETLKYSKSETEEIRKRSNMLQDSLSKHDIANQQLTEELIQTKSMSESLNLEISNLKLEKQLWKSIEKRLNDDNTNLLEERLRLNNLTSDLQRLENERDKSFNESTSRLNTTIASLEEELSLLKSKLEVNTEELRSALLRKDSDAKAYQERIESLRNELSSAREDIIKRRTLSDQLEQTVQNLKKQLHDTEQQLKLYESTDELDTEENVEVRLRQDLQKTKIELENTLSDLNASNESIEQFKSVANAAESRLAELTSSYDEYKKSVEAKLNESNEMNENMVKQISDLNNNISELQKQVADAETEKQKTVTALNNEIESLKVKAASTDEVRAEYEQRMNLIKKDLEQQANIATECQKNYEEELQKHADVSKINTKLREEESLLKIKIQELTIESRDSKNALVSSQESWENQKLTLQEELKIAESRVGDLNLQNRMLLNQLELITKQQKDSFAENSERNTISTNDIGESSEELLQVVSFLRHEKEISDAQLEVSKLEQKRLQQNLEITRQDLEDTKLQLIRLQTREQHSEQLEENYKKLTEKINQLDILRESNNTLRQETQKYSNQVKALEEQLRVNIEKLEPLEFEVVNLRLELETKNKELESEKSIVEFWKNKNQEILQNYNRIDPEEHNNLKLKIEELTPYVGQVEELNKKLSDLEQGYQNERKKSIREANDRLTKFKGIIDVTKKELTEEKQKSSDLQQELEVLQKKLEEAAAASVGTTSDHSHDQEAFESLSKELEEAKQLLVQANKEREEKLKEISTSRDLLQKQVEELQNKLNAAANGGTTGDAEIESLRSSFEKEKLELTKKLNDELEQQKFKLRIEIKKELEDQAKSSALAVENSPDIESLRKQLEAEHAKDVEIKVKEACDALKAKIREPHEAKINGIVNKRFEKLKQEAEIEIKKKEEELVNKYESKLKETSNNQALEEEIKKLKESIEVECKKAKEEGRSSALKEGEMRYKMTKRQLDKTKAESAKLKAELAKYKGEAVVTPSPTPVSLEQATALPTKPAVGTPVNAGSRIPTHNFRENLKKPQILKPQQEEDAKGVKRGADENVGDEVAEKKSKNE